MYVLQIRVALFPSYSWDLWTPEGSACHPKDIAFACISHSVNKKWKCGRSTSEHCVIKQLSADLVLFGHYSCMSCPCGYNTSTSCRSSSSSGFRLETKAKWKKKGGGRGREYVIFKSLHLKIRSCLEAAWQKERWLSPTPCSEQLHWQPQTHSPAHHRMLMAHEMWGCIYDTFNFSSFTAEQWVAGRRSP